jgi:hypothetical protein
MEMNKFQKMRMQTYAEQYGDRYGSVANGLAYDSFIEGYKKGFSESASEFKDSAKVHFLDQTLDPAVDGVLKHYISMFGVEGYSIDLILKMAIRDAIKVGISLQEQVESESLSKSEGDT